MKLWLLKPRDDLREGSPWGFPTEKYDVAEGFVIRAETQAEARRMAQEMGGIETQLASYCDNGVPAWTDEAYSICVELTTDGGTEVVLYSYAAG